MSTEQLKEEAMALPLSDRVSLAQALWESIDAGLTDTDRQTAVREAIRRDQELSAGAIEGRTHEQVVSRYFGVMRGPRDLSTNKVHRRPWDKKCE